MRKLYDDVIVIVPVFNGEKLIEKCINSILSQTYKNFIIIIRDDMSTDKTVEIIKNLYSKYDNIYLIENEKKLYPCGNIYKTVIDFVGNDHSIIITVDGDDELIDQNAFKKIINVYERKNKWLVWSQHETASGNLGQSKPLPNDEYIITNRNYWSVSHLRTAKAFLYKKINENDLLDFFDKNTYMKFAGDAALLFPMIEMSLNEKSEFINESFYKYNDNLITNETSVNMSMAIHYGSRIRNKGKKYRKLKESEIPIKNIINITDSEKFVTTTIEKDLNFLKKKNNQYEKEIKELKNEINLIKNKNKSEINLINNKINIIKSKVKGIGWKLW
ncbi:MAG: glycosyltransferase family 2 protein [bacterium]